MITSLFVYLTRPLVVHRMNRRQQRHTVTEYPLDEIPGAKTALDLGLGWLRTRLEANEEPVQTLIEPAGYNAETECPEYNLVITTQSPEGSRTLTFSTAEMPEPVREAMLGVIAYLENETDDEH